MKNISPRLVLAFVMVLIAIPLFGRLDMLPIRLWDESRQAINALEMYENDNYLVTYYRGLPDMWNTKPPLMVCLQVASMHLFGINEFAIRIPAAIAGYLTCILIFLFVNKRFNNLWIAAFSSLILATTQGYVMIHGTRTGDYDALLCLWLVISSFSLFDYLDKGKTVNLYIFFLSCALAILTKSTAGLLMGPAWLVYILYKKSFIKLLKQSHFWISFLLLIGMVGSYYYVRELHNPGYLKAFNENEFAGRYLTVLEKNSNSFTFYLNRIFYWRYSFWIYFSLFGFIIGANSKQKTMRDFTYLSLSICVIFILIISYAKTKLEWYELPIFPFLSIMAGIMCYHIMQIIWQNKWLEGAQKSTKYTAVGVMVIAFMIQYVGILKNTIFYKELPDDRSIYYMSYYLKDRLDAPNTLANQYCMLSGYTPHVDYYVHKVQAKQPSFQSIELNKELNETDINKFKIGATIIFYQENVKDFIAKHFIYTMLKEENNVYQYQIINRR